MSEQLRGAALEVNAFGTTASFRLLKDFERTDELRRSFAVGGRAQVVNEVLGQLNDDSEGRRRGFYIDAGAGEWSIELNASLSAAEVKGGHLQMGNTGNPDALTKVDATGADPVTQAEVMQRVVRAARTDSQSPAKLHIGHYHDGAYIDSGDPGLFEGPLDVVIPEGPRIVRASDSPSSVDIALTCIVTATVDGAIDAISDDGS